MSSAHPAVSILIPTYNEQESIGACLQAVAAVFSHDAEVLVVDGGHDQTEQRVRELCDLRELRVAVRYLRNHPDRGKGHAIRRGLAEARAPIVAQLDADLQFLPAELPRLIAPLQLGAADLVLGSRFLPGSVRLPGSTPALRSAGNRLTSAYASLLSGARLTDVLSGIKAWTRAASDRIDLQSDSYSYEVELPMRAIRRGLRVLEVPVTTRARLAGQSQVALVRDGARILFDISRFGLGAA